MGAEIARKAVHVAASLGAAAVVGWLEPVVAATILAGATFVALAIETLRRLAPLFERRFQGFVGPMLRPPERGRLTGATTLAIGYTLAAVTLPGRAAVLGILLTGIADAAAALVGSRFGTRRFAGGKSVEGSAAFFLAALPIAWAVGGTGFGAALGLAAVATLLEAPSLPVDDNLYLPLAVAGAAVAIAALSGRATFFLTLTIAGF